MVYYRIYFLPKKLNYKIYLTYKYLKKTLVRKKNMKIALIVGVNGQDGTLLTELLLGKIIWFMV